MKWLKYLNRGLSIFNNFILIPLVIVLIFHYLYSFCNVVIFEIIPSNLFISILLIDIIYLILLGIIGKSNISYIVLISGLILLFIVNQIKIIYMNEPLFFSDFNFVSKASNIANIVGSTFFNEIKSCLKFFIILLVLFIVIYFYQFIFKFEVKSVTMRIISSSIGLLLLFLLFFPFSWSKDLYEDIFFDVDNYTDYNSYTSYVSLYSYYGIIGGMYYQLLDSRLDIPDNYDDNELEEILLDVSNNESDKNIGKPNIIVVLSETFFDVALLKDNIIFDKDVTKNFSSLKNEGYSFNIISPSYGGMTANVTFELLTGGNMSYFSNGYIPFMQLYDDEMEINSIVRELSDNGYDTQIFMGNDSYGSKELLTNMGFKKYIEIKENDDNVKGEWVSDDYVADMIIDAMDEEGNEKFIMVETMQSHMGYLPSKYSNYDINIKMSNLSKDCNGVLLSYAQGIYDADKMLKKLYDYIQTIGEETILIFFGDHLPYLKSSKRINVIDKLDYFNTDDKITNLYRLYNTESLILSNYDIDLNLNKNDYLGFDLLLVSLINQMDIEVDSYYKWLYSTKDILPSYNKYVALDNSGNVYDIYNMPQNMKEVYNLRNLMMYKMFVK